MKTNDFFTPIGSSKLLENFERHFGAQVNLDKYTREELEDMRNKLRTRVFQHEGSAGYSELLTNEAYQKDMAMLQLLNTRIKEMLGENLKQLRDKMVELSEAKKGVRDVKRTKKSKGTKPDFLDMDNDGNKTEPMKKAIKDKKVKESEVSETHDEFGAKKSDVPAYKRKASGNPDWKVSTSDLEKEKARSKSSPAGLAKKKKDLGDQGVMEADSEFGAKKSDVPAYKRKASGDPDWKVSTSDLDKEQSRSKSTSGGIARKKKELSDQGVMEADKPSAGMTKKEKSAVVKKARAGKDIGKPGKGFEKVEKAAKKGGARDPKAVAAAAMWKQQAKESFKRNVAIVNESLTRMINEDEEGKAKTITAASDIVNDFTSWMQRVGQYQTKALIELADAIRADFGLQQSEQFKAAVSPALAATLETLTQQREAISNAVAVLAGEDLPQDQMGMEPGMDMEEPDMGPEMEPAGPDMMNEPGDEFGASDAAAGAGITGREMRESRFAQKLAESHSIMFKLAK
jgi:hypothetical protein